MSKQRGESEGTHDWVQPGSVAPVLLTLITLDPELQMRVGLNEGVVEDYAEKRKARVKMPPVVIFCEGEGEEIKAWLADGFHRFEAAQRLGDIAIRAEMREGGRREAFLYAVKANQTHGLPLTREDKRRTLSLFLSYLEGLSDEERKGWSNRRIAERVGVSHPMVGAALKRLHGIGGCGNFTTQAAPLEGEDNDCDGLIDEGVDLLDGDDQGEEISAEPHDQVESDRIDNDCDGEIDEGDDQQGLIDEEGAPQLLQVSHPTPALLAAPPAAPSQEVDEEGWPLVEWPLAIEKGLSPTMRDAMRAMAWTSGPHPWPWGSQAYLMPPITETVPRALAGGGAANARHPLDDPLRISYSTFEALEKRGLIVVEGDERIKRSLLKEAEEERTVRLSDKAWSAYQAAYPSRIRRDDVRPRIEASAAQIIPEEKDLVINRARELVVSIPVKGSSWDEIASKVKEVVRRVALLRGMD